MEENPIMYQKALKALGVQDSLSCDKAIAICKIFEFNREPFQEYCDAHHVAITGCSTDFF
ncbi:hypothetical protein [Methanocorpusculum labreanum]|uniref:hypothetical protein n=1 Tax=Methanocorpusculum labreanum TaxID=83984 RepID=UPI000321E51C|nr:hypothetical protein [Methanocorpusculum labreanum]